MSHRGNADSLARETGFVFPPIATERVLLRTLTRDDAVAVYHHFSDSEVTRFMDIEPCKSVDEALEIIDFHLEDTGCRWGVFGKVTGNLLGTCGYHAWVRGENAKAEIGFDLGKAYWGQSFMTEVLPPVIKFGFKVMRLTRIEAAVEPANSRSTGLLEKLGFHLEAKLRAGLLCFYILPNLGSIRTSK